jgi:hypothetical protein
MGEGANSSPTSVSPGGKLVMGVRASGAQRSGKEVWVLPLGGGAKTGEVKPEPSLLWEAPERWSVHRMARDGEEAAGGQAPRNQNGVETPPS